MPAITFSTTEVIRFTLVLLRVGGIMVFTPVFNTRSVPYQVKTALALFASLALAPATEFAVPDHLTLMSLVMYGLVDVLFGLVLGLTASFLFAGLQLAGQVIGFQMGFSLVYLIDPQSEVETSVISLLENYFGLIIFFLINGHHWFFMAVGDSFKYMPVRAFVLQESVVRDVIRLSALVFSSGLQIAAPVLAVTVIADIVLGIIGRTAPQINILVVGMPLKTLVGFACLSMSFYFMPRFLEGSYMQYFQNIFALLHRLH